MPDARLHSQMVCTQSEPAEIPQHMFVQILVQVGGDRKRRTTRTTLRTPTPFVIRHCFLVYCARTWKISFPPYLQMSEMQIANELKWRGTTFSVCASWWLRCHQQNMHATPRFWDKNSFTSSCSAAVPVRGTFPETTEITNFCRGLGSSELQGAASWGTATQKFCHQQIHLPDSTLT